MTWLSPYANMLNLLGPAEKEFGVKDVIDLANFASANGNVLFFIGNGGSAAIASHMAIDWQKAANIASMCFNDGASLTAYANDLGYENVFSEPLRMHAGSGDILFAISSSGRSASIVNAAHVGKALGMTVVTLSGFDPNNPLRQIGDFNFYVPSQRYGVVEATHFVICHAILDEVVGVDA